MGDWRPSDMFLYYTTRIDLDCTEIKILPASQIFFSNMGAGHRAGPLKQSNKKHKSGQHRSKGALDAIARGRLGCKAVAGKHRFLVGKKARRSQAQQIRENKRAILLSESCSFSNNYIQQPPIFVTVLSFNKDYAADELVALLCSCDETSYRNINYNGCLNHLCIKQFKSRYVFTAPNCSDIDIVLDYVKISDVIAFIWPSCAEVTEDDSILMSILLALGLSVTVHFVPGLGTMTTKQKEIARKNVTKLIANWSFGGEKLMQCDSESDGLLALRLISTVKKKLPYMQRIRPYLIAENVEKCETEGSLLNVNSLIHIPRLGDFQMKQIVIEDDPYAPDKEVRINMKTSRTIFKPDVNLQTSLLSEMITDPMDAEQTWPTEEEIMKEASYQAEWIINDEDEISDEEVEDELEDSNAMKQAVNDMESDIENELEVEKMSGISDTESSMDLKDEEINMEEVKNIEKLVKMSIFELSAFQKIALSNIKTETEYNPPRGAFVSIYVSKVPTSLIDIWPRNMPLIIYGLLAHEQKMSLVNMVLRKHPSCAVPIRNKERLLFHLGYRYFEAEPIFSQHMNGDKFKMERFMPNDGTFVASVFAPIMFPPVPALVYRLDKQGNKQLVATGCAKCQSGSNHPETHQDIEWFKPVELHTPSGRRGHIKEALGTHGHMKCVFDQQLNAMDTVMMNLYKRVFPKWTYKPLMLHPSSGRPKESESMET
ncbi:Pre-rRNA-processing protein TSR1 [Dirofilaria immitis]|nr:Pre-rRNA-processing protein TSR1 [Dirofilaria immitis]